MNNQKKPLVLIVDDNPQNLKMLGNILKEKPYRQALAQNGTEALDFIKKKRPDIILLDIMMPEMNGFEVCQKLKQDAELSEIPVIFLTAKTEKKEVIKGLKQGAVDYVTKPFNSQELITRVSTHLELKAAKEALLEKVEELKEANATKDKFFAIIAHDLMSPFNALLGLSELLLEEKDINAEKREKLLKIIQQASKTGYNLLKNLLEWSRFQTGRMAFRPEKINLKEIVSANFELLNSNAVAKNIHIFSTILETSYVFADRNMLNTIIRNLLSNAIKFTPEKGKIEVVCCEKEAHIEIAISDTGVGINSQDINKLFRTDITYSTIGTRQETGTGLGLILCQEFVEKHGGKIWVESELGKGSRFYIRLSNSGL
ncbi:MAG TPA: hybrid sensor histidine kinase/response regulator [Thiotrichaceae bacterium]|nr:hybrid sensor histidine kinase/response regulator [Thiotrichaceae bacterium]